MDSITPAPPILTGWYTIPAVDTSILSPNAYTMYMRLGMCIPGGDPDHANTDPMDMDEIIEMVGMTPDEIRESIKELHDFRYIDVFKASEFEFDDRIVEYIQVDESKNQVVFQFLFSYRRGGTNE